MFFDPQYKWDSGLPTKFVSKYNLSINYPMKMLSLKDDGLLKSDRPGLSLTFQRENSKNYETLISLL